MTECAQCGDDFHRVEACRICGDAYCPSHRRRAQHDSVDATNPGVRPLRGENWGRLSHVVNKVLFVLFSVTLFLMTVELLL